MAKRKKAPAMQFYVKDWLADMAVRRLTPASRGIWIDILAYMWMEDEQGKLEVEIDELARMTGATIQEVEKFLREAQQKELCEITLSPNVPNCPANVLLISRRMHEEWKVRNYEKMKKRKQRSSGQCPENVPSPSSSSSALPSKKVPLNTPISTSPGEGQNGSVFEGDSPPRSGPKILDCPSKGRPSRQGFMACWQVYPLQQGEEAAWREWCRLEDNGTLEEAWAIRDRIMLMAQEDDRWKDGYTPRFEKWLRDKGWNDQPYKKPSAPTPGGGPSGQPRASTQAQKNAQDREGMAMAVLESRRRRENAENQQRQDSGRIGGTGLELPGGDDRADAAIDAVVGMDGGPWTPDGEAVS